MAGSPKKRARRQAARRAQDQQQAAANTGASPQSAPDGETPASAALVPASAVPVVHAEIVPPGDAAEPTRTALKRAMRARAQEHAEKAIAVLVVNLDSKDPRIATAAANDLLAWGFGKPATEIEAGEGAQLIVIRKFGEPV